MRVCSCDCTTELCLYAKIPHRLPTPIDVRSPGTKQALVRKQSIELLTATLTMTLAAACGPAPEPQTASDPAPTTALPPPPAPPPAPVIDPSAGPAYGANPALRVAVSGPAQAKPYRSGIAGGEPYKVTVKLTNGSNADVPVASPNVFFQVRRDNVEYPCAPTTGTMKSPAGEPAQLSPGQSFTLSREVSCDLPVVGKYEVRAYLRFGAGGAPDPKELIGTLPVDVVPAAGTAHTPYAEKPGLVVVMSGGSQTRPLTADEAKKGQYSAWIDVTNTTPQPVELKNPKVVFQATREGAKVKCLPDMEKAVLQGPATLEPGRTHRFTAPVQCDLSKEGSYEINGFVSFGEQVKGGASTGKLTLMVAKEGTMPASVSTPNAAPPPPPTQPKK